MFRGWLWKREFEIDVEFCNEMPKIVDLCDKFLYPSIKILHSILATTLVWQQWNARSQHYDALRHGSGPTWKKSD